jgi:hypothetical protein
MAGLGSARLGRIFFVNPADVMSRPAPANAAEASKPLLTDSLNRLGERHAGI